MYIYLRLLLQAKSDKSTNEVSRDLDEEMARVFAGVSSETDTNRFDLSKFASDRSPRPGDRRFSEDDYTGKSSLSIYYLILIFTITHALENYI